MASGLESNEKTRLDPKDTLPQEVAGTSDVAKKITESGLEMASYVPPDKRSLGIADPIGHT